jgi:hypothetical protein
LKWSYASRADMPYRVYCPGDHVQLFCHLT